VLFGLLLLLQTRPAAAAVQPRALLVWRRQTLVAALPYERKWPGLGRVVSPLTGAVYFRETAISSTCCQVLFDATAPARAAQTCTISAPEMTDPSTSP